jgi:hypothetical protein
MIEISPNPIDLKEGERDALVRAIWEWEIGEPMAENGTCMIQALAKAIDLCPDDIREMFIRAFCDPQYLDAVIETLGNNGYEVSKHGPEGLGLYRGHRRLVTISLIADRSRGHAFLVYEEDRDVFDSSGFIKKFSDIIRLRSFGYKIDDVLLIQKGHHS